MSFEQLVQLLSAVGIIAALGANAFVFSQISRQRKTQGGDGAGPTYFREDQSRIYYGPYGAGAVYGPYGSPIRDFLVVVIAQAEQRYSVNLTPAGREMLIIPVVEALQADPQEFNLGQAQRSIFEIMGAIAQAGAGADTRPRVHNSQSVIRAFWKKFCNIPPFCNGRGPE